MLRDISPSQLAAEVVDQIHGCVTELAKHVGATVGKPKTPPIEVWIKEIVLYAQTGGGRLSNQTVQHIINSLLRVLSATWYPPATPLAASLWDRRAGEPENDLEVVLLAARARWGIETSLHVPIRWLAPLGGVSVKTARNLASEEKLITCTISGNQVCSPTEAARWLATRDIEVRAGWRA